MRTGWSLVELIVEVDDTMPPHALLVRVDGDEVKVTVNSEPVAKVLATLRAELGMAIANYLDPGRRS